MIIIDDFILLTWLNMTKSFWRSPIGCFTIWDQCHSYVHPGASWRNRPSLDLWSRNTLLWMYFILAYCFMSRIWWISPLHLLLIWNEGIKLQTLGDLSKWNLSITFSKALLWSILFGPNSIENKMCPKNPYLLI